MSRDMPNLSIRDVSDESRRVPRGVDIIRAQRDSW